MAFSRKRTSILSRAIAPRASKCKVIFTITPIAPSALARFAIKPIQCPSVPFHFAPLFFGGPSFFLLLAPSFSAVASAANSSKSPSLARDSAASSGNRASCRFPFPRYLNNLRIFAGASSNRGLSRHVAITNDFALSKRNTGTNFSGKPAPVSILDSAFRQSISYSAKYSSTYCSVGRKRMNCITLW